MLQGFSIPQTTKRQRNHAPAALLRLGALAQRLTTSGKHISSYGAGVQLNGNLCSEVLDSI